MKQGRPAWDARLTAAQRQRIDAAIASSGLTARAIYERFDLQRHCGYRTFARHVMQERARRAGDAAASPESPHSSSSASAWSKVEAGIQLMQQSVEAMRDAMTAGTVKASTLPEFARIARDMLRFDLEEAAELRAAELHAAKLESLRAAVKSEVAAATEGGQALTREAVYDLVDKVMRGEAA